MLCSLALSRKHVMAGIHDVPSMIGCSSVLNLVNAGQGDLLPPVNSVIKARMKKLEPPVKSVILSN